MTIRALVADDSADTRALIRASLLGFGDFEIVGEASNGAEAVALAGEHEPDVVILDLAMPVMDGIAALPEIRRRSPASRIVVFTAFNRQDLRDDAARLGADAYSVKGIDPRALVALVERSVAGVRGRILLAQSPGHGGAYRASLEGAGFSVASAADVAEMTRLLAERNFDLVMVDLRLGSEDGLAPLRARPLGAGPGYLPVVVLLADHENPGAIDRAFSLGAAACVSRRAVTPSDLPGRVDAWMEQGPNFRAV